MTIALGIDTGGTYTDAVLLEHETGHVLAAAKALTTRRNLAIGIRQAVQAVLDRRTATVDMVALSTTLATNAIVEGQGSPVCLLLIGYNANLIHKYGFERELATANVVYLPGGHDGMGNELEPLDEEAARRAILAWQDRVEAFAISGHFSVRNPAHEQRVRELVETLAPTKSATCGHELTSRLNAVRRATTTALNARLIPLLKELIATVRHTLDEMEITAPLMVVKGDGSLVRAGWAIERPIETILSGPAASVVGAWHLAGQKDVWVVDVGGTTTDIAVLGEGRPRLNPAGAQVGRWQTMVEAVDVHTIGLGGDSQVQIERSYAPDREWLAIGPRRVIPLALLADEHPAISDELRLQQTERQRLAFAGQFVLAGNRQIPPDLADSDRQLLERLAAGPRSIIALTSRQGHHRFIVPRQIERLTARRLILQAGFTPTDALHVLGEFQQWNGQAARLGAELLAEQAGLPVEDFCRRVVNRLSDRIATELVGKLLTNETTAPNWSQEPTAAALLARALSRVPASGLECRFALRQPVVAIGAPVAAYLPRTVEQLHTGLIIPDHAEVANAVGAVVGGVIQQARVLIHPLDSVESRFRAHLLDEVHDSASLEEAVAYARQVVPPRLEELARQAGAAQIEIQIEREDQIAPIAVEWGGQLYLSTTLTFTAIGRPAATQG